MLLLIAPPEFVKYLVTGKIYDGNSYDSHLVTGAIGLSIGLLYMVTVNESSAVQFTLLLFST